MTLFRLLAFFTLLVFSGHTVLPALHHALLAHEVCAEHGHLVHGGPAKAHGHAASIDGEAAPSESKAAPSESKAAPSDSTAPRQYHASEDQEHAHDHCAQCAAFRLHHAALLGSDASQTDSWVASRAPAMRRADVCAPDGLGLHRLAPKQGPPSVG